MTLFAGVNESASRAFTLAEGVAAELVAAYEELDVAAPDRRYVWFSTPAVDCEQLVVSFTRIYTGIPSQEGNEPQYGNLVQRVVEMRIEVHRCVPVVDESGTPPEPVAMQAAAETLINDAWVVRRALEAYPTVIGQLKSVGTQEPIEAQGGFAGFSQVFSLGLP